MLADGQPFTPVASLKPDVGKTVSLHIMRGDKGLDKELRVESKPVMDMFLDATMDSAHTIDLGKRKSVMCTSGLRQRRSFRPPFPESFTTTSKIRMG